MLLLRKTFCLYRKGFFNEENVMYMISEKEIEVLYQKLITLSVKNTDKKIEMTSEDELECIALALATYTGKQLYKNLTDEQLLFILRQIADILGYSPSQKEVFWVLREYIKLRFKKWPYALSAAGLNKSAGCGGKKKAD